MRKQTHFKKVVSFALAAAMAVSVCTAALAEDVEQATPETAVSAQSAETTNSIAVLTAEEVTPLAANVAQVGDKEYATLQDAVDAAADGATVKLLADTDLSSTVVVQEKKITLDLNGKKIFNTDDIWVGNNWSLLSIRKNGNVTITGNGVMAAKKDDCYTIDLSDDGATCVIENGEFIGNIHAVYVHTGSLTVKGGTYSIQQLYPTASIAYSFTLNCYDPNYKNGTAKIQVTGGRFYKYNPSNDSSEGAGTNFTTSDCVTTQDGDWFVVTQKEVDVKPAKPADTEVPTTEDEVKVDESSSVTASDVIDAAKTSEIATAGDTSADKVSEVVNSAATVTIDNEEVSLADEKVKDKAREEINNAVSDGKISADDVSTNGITIVAEPKLVVEPKAAVNNDTDASMTFDIEMVYDVKATVADDIKNMTEANTVTLEKNKKMAAADVPTVAISLDISALKIPADQKVFVRHVKEDGTVYYYAADTTPANGIVKTITFVNPDGFSEFTVMANKGVTVKIDGQDVTFTTDDIGKAFTAVPQEGYVWLGVSINGTVYTTFTKELYDAAYKGEALVGANAYEEIAKPAPVEEAAPVATAAPTATPDDSQYYTCVACGHHDWTATADGYKCNYCGHLETKQISGYKNVKGVYTPSTSSAKTAAAKASTIPQTSDEMPIVPIAIVAIAALLGLGVTAYMKKKQN